MMEKITTTTLIALLYSVGIAAIISGLGLFIWAIEKEKPLVIAYFIGGATFFGIWMKVWNDR